MSLLAALLPRTFTDWIATETRARCERWFGIADAQLDQAEAELADRRAFSGVSVKAIATPEAPRVNGRRKSAA